MYHKDKKNETLIIFDEKTKATTYEDVKTIIKVEKRHFKKGEFFMQSFSLENLILEKKYTITELRVLFLLKKRLDFNNRIKGFKQIDLASEIGTSQGNISRAIKRLENDLIIKRDGIDFYFNDIYIKGSGNSKG